MRRLPLWPTLVTFVALSCLIALGIWQLQRREWKADLIARLEAAQSLPLLEPADFQRAMTRQKSVQYRRAELLCAPGEVLPYDLKGGTSLSGTSGYMVLVSCRPNRKPPDIVAVAGWTRRPDALTRPVTVDTLFTGTIIERPYGDAPDRPQFMLIPDTAVAPLQPARQPSPRDLPDNHLQYAGTWFGLGGALLGVFGVWLRRRWRAPDVAAPATPS